MHELFKYMQINLLRHGLIFLKTFKSNLTDMCKNLNKINFFNLKYLKNF